MTQNEYSSLLRGMITKYDVSVNNAIKKTSINRSSFYKFMNGSRLPTPAQLQEIIQNLGMSDSDAQLLQRGYEEVRYGTVAWINHEIVRECLNSVSEAEFSSRFEVQQITTPNEIETGSHDTDNETAESIKSDLTSAVKEKIGMDMITGRSSVDHALIQFMEISSQLNDSSAIYAFLPLEATRLLTKYCHGFCSDRHQIHFLFHFSSTTDDIDKHSSPKFHDLIPMALSVQSVVHFFYGASNLLDGLGLLYPYYMISSIGVLFMNAKMDAAYLETSSQTVRMYQQAYERILPLTDEITHRNKSLAEMQMQIMSALRSTDKIFLLDPTPCMSLMATEGLVNLLAPENMRSNLWKFCLSLQEAKPVEIVSMNGLHKMATQYYLSESGVKIQATKEIVHEVLIGLRKRLGNTFFISDSNHITVPEDFGVTVVPGQYVSLVPYLDSYDTVSFLEKNVLNAFSVAFERDMDYFILDQKEAEKVLNHYIDMTQ